MYRVSIEDHFSAAHRLREYDGNCERLHGHNWRVQVFFKSSGLDSLGLSIDFRIAKKMLADVLKTFDHVCLNDLELFRDKNPSCENIARIIFRRLAQRLLETPLDHEVRLDEVTVWESPGSSVTYRVEEREP